MTELKCVHSEPEVRSGVINGCWPSTGTPPTPQAKPQDGATPSTSAQPFSRLYHQSQMGLHVFLREAALPTREEWQAGIAGYGFGLILDEALDVRHHTGFSSATYRGKKAGFEFDLHPAVQIASRGKGVSERIGTRDLSANFRWRANVVESVVVYIASAVFARLAGGILYYPQKASFSTSHEAMAMVRQLIEATELD